jgi:hypothetical protein
MLTMFYKFHFFIETPHSEDLFYIFNRTDIEPVSKSHADFKIVHLFQSIFDNFAKFG